MINARDDRRSRKERNKERIKEFFKKNPNASKRECAEALRLSWVTVHHLIQEINHNES